MLIRDTNPIIIAYYTIIQPFKLLISSLKRKKSARFILLTPYFLTNQYLYDREKKVFFKIKIRSKIDFKTLCQIYLSNDYDLRKIGRHYELKCHYHRILNEGKIPLIIDCGGNIGLASRYFNDDYPAAKILLVEPEHLNIEQAKKITTKIKYIFTRKQLDVVMKEVN